jgi:hypothetical protein
MIDHKSVAEWLNAYVAAWKSYDPQAIGDLFAAEATYSFNPFDDEAIRGREAIVANWLEYQDAPGTFDAHYEPIAVDGNIAVANGRSIYYEEDGTTLERVFDNIFVLRFDDQRRCVEFREWYMPGPDL